MSMTLRGNGSYKNEFMSSLRENFGTAPFSYREASKLPGFEHRIFHTLLNDDLLKPATKGEKKGKIQPKLWKLIDVEEMRIKRKYARQHFDSECCREFPQCMEA